VIVTLENCKTCIISINYNGENDTIRLAGSIEELNSDLGLIVIDNSVNGSCLSELEEMHSSVKIIYNDENVGFGRANNIGVRFANEFKNIENIFILNNDAFFTQKNSVSILEDLVDSPDVDIVSPVIQDFGTDKVWFAKGSFSLLNAGAKSFFKGSELNIINRLPAIYESEFITGCAMFMKKSTYIDIGGFDDAYFMYVEDIDFCYRIKNSGLKTYATRDVIIQHESHSSILKGSNRNIGPLDEGNKNRLFYIDNVLNNSFLFADKNLKGITSALFKVILIIKWFRNAYRIKNKDDREAVFMYLKNKVFNVK
jgi:GT2 family glycosyltransferase